MKLGRYVLLLACLTATVALISCQSKENEAKELVLQAHVMINNGDWMALRNHLEMIVAEYPDTRAGETAREMLQKMISQVNDLAETVLKQALVTAIACQASYPESDITMKRLREFGFKSVKDVIVEIDEPQADDFLISAWHQAGDLIWFVGPDGSPWAESPRAYYRVTRGGTWGYEAKYCRSAARSGPSSNFGSSDVGFRLVREVE